VTETGFLVMQFSCASFARI